MASAIKRNWKTAEIIQPIILDTVKIMQTISYLRHWGGVHTHIHISMKVISIQVAMYNILTILLLAVIWYYQKDIAILLVATLDDLNGYFCTIFTQWVWNLYCTGHVALHLSYHTTLAPTIWNILLNAWFLNSQIQNYYWLHVQQLWLYSCYMDF